MLSILGILGLCLILGVTVGVAATVLGITSKKGPVGLIAFTTLCMLEGVILGPRIVATWERLFGR